MSIEILALLDPSTPDTWPQGILAAADLREQRAKAVLEISKAPWTAFEDGVFGPDFADGSLRTVAETVYFEEAVHIAAEANPGHALAAVRRWRGVVDRHSHPDYACDDLTETADEARAYAGGTP